ncbi:MAG: hypothetical protein ACRD0K_04940 [Egibacteraceae bacterium]
MNRGTWPEWSDWSEFARLKALTDRLMVGETVRGSTSPISRFNDIVADRNAGGGRWGEAKCAQAALDPYARTLDPDLAQRVEKLPQTRPAEIAIVLEWLREASDSPRGNAPRVHASALVWGELCYHFRRAADQLRSWGALPGHFNDWVGVEWAAYAAVRIRSGCDCDGGRGCRHPEIHQISSWLDPRTHQRKGESGSFPLGNWLERACCGHSPAFKPVGTSSQGLIFAAEPDLDEGDAAVRLCHNEECPEHREPVTMGRPCPRCRQEPAGAIRLRLKVVNTRSWVRRRFVRCCGQPADEHFLERTEKCCPECDWRPEHERPEYITCHECCAHVHWDDTVCTNGHAVPKARGVKRAWVYNPPFQDPLDPRSTPWIAIEGHGGQAPAASQWSIGFSHDASELLSHLRSGSSMSRRRVNEFVHRLALVSPSWRQALGLTGRPSDAQRGRAVDALERLCVRTHTADQDALLRGELARMFSEWNKEVF